MRTKDFLNPAFEFGTHPDGRVDVHFSGEDLCTLPPSDAKVMIELFNERGAAIQWLLDNCSEELRHKFARYIDTLPMHLKFVDKVV